MNEAKKVSCIVKRMPQKMIQEIMSQLQENEIQKFSEIVYQPIKITPEEEFHLYNEIKHKILVKDINEEDNRWAFFVKSDLRAFFESLKGEAVEVVSLIISQMPKKYIAEILRLTEGKKAAEIVNRISKISQVKNEVLDLVYEELKKKFNSNLALNETLKVLTYMSPQEKNRIFSSMSEEKREIFKKFESSMYTYQDILALDQMSIKKLISIIPQETLIAAFSKEKGNLIEKITEHLPRLSRSSILSKAKTRKFGSEQIRSAQSQINKTMKEFAAKGEIRFEEKE